MGQGKWAYGCALVLAAVVGNFVVAQEAADPFGDGGAPAPRSAAAAANASTPPASASSYSPQDAKQRIESVLDQPLSEPLDFVQQPLRDVVMILSETYDIPIQFDNAALDAIAASPDVEVSVQINNVGLRSALDLMLKNAGAEELTYIIDNEVLLVTTQEEAERRLETIVYRVDDLVDDGSLASAYTADADTLIDIIVASVDHESWMENGTGEGEINAFPPGMIVIAQTSRVHKLVERLLDDLRRNKAAVDAAMADQRAAAVKRPVSRSIAIDPKSVAAEESQHRIREALMKSVEWNPADVDVADDDKFLLILNDRVLVRHVPHVVAQVEHSLKDLKLQPPRMGGSICGSNTGGQSGPGLAEPAAASEDGGGRRGGGMF
jgi:hypothetical protein